LGFPQAKKVGSMDLDQWLQKASRSEWGVGP